MAARHDGADGMYCVGARQTAAPPPSSMKPGEMARHAVFGQAQTGRRRVDGALLAFQKILVSHCAAIYRSSTDHCISCRRR